MPPRLRNLYAGALVKVHAGESEESMSFLQQIIESPVANSWRPDPSDSPFFILRNAEDLLARMLLESGDEAAATQVYRRAIVLREQAERRDQYQIIFAKQRLARFLLEQGENEEAHELLSAARDAVQDGPKCFDWLRKRIQENLTSLGDHKNSQQ